MFVPLKLKLEAWNATKLARGEEFISIRLINACDSEKFVFIFDFSICTIDLLARCWTSFVLIELYLILFRSLIVCPTIYGFHFRDKMHVVISKFNFLAFFYFVMQIKRIQCQWF